MEQVATPETVAEVKYTRAQAIAEHLLMDITPIIETFGFKLPAAVSIDVFLQCLMVEDEQGEADSEKMAERLVDMITDFLNRLHTDKEASASNILKLDIRFDDEHPPIEARLHGGDEGEPVMTFMFPIEG